MTEIYKKALFFCLYCFNLLRKYTSRRIKRNRNNGEAEKASDSIRLPGVMSNYKNKLKIHEGLRGIGSR